MNYSTLERALQKELTLNDQEIDIGILKFRNMALE